MSTGYKDRLIALSGVESSQINRFYRAALYASQYTAYQTSGDAFQLLEGEVRKNKAGQYIFKPNKHLATLLETKNYPELLKIEESRFVELIRIALSEAKKYE